ncbi:unnamed protein product [Rotaria sp. Silwood1]|nr:unnamed protein product [Rotaria sp. Silwood1]CAF4664074.1 unnamed protein product [Rotaria sp. Silwood1]CAF4740094.1 unnamed protein product [Rotaria sp. Silwood1]
MTAADVLFNQADLNQDQQIDINEFRNFTGAGGLSYGASDYGYGDLSTLGYAGDYGYSSIIGGGGYGGGYGGDIIYTGSGYGGAGYNASLYDSSIINAGLGSVNYLSTPQWTGYQRYATDARGLYQDPNPQIIRRPAPGGGLTYAQRIRLRFLQPPPVPPPGPLIIKEVRPPQPPPPAPLRIRQRAPPFPPPPPLILRERPPIPPPRILPQTVIRRLPALPVPPRSVIVERLPPLPPKPRDIILERWIQYGPQPRRRAIVQRAPPVRPYPIPRNIVIQYERVPAHVVRQFQHLGVVQENPALYVQRYGASLLDAYSLVQMARAAGVVENISPPGFVGSLTGDSSQVLLSGGNLGYDITNAFGGYNTFDAGITGFNDIVPYQSSYYTGGTDFSTFGADLGSFELLGADAGGTTSFESSSLNVTNDATVAEAAVAGVPVDSTTFGNATVSSTTLGDAAVIGTTVENRAVGDAVRLDTSASAVTLGSITSTIPVESVVTTDVKRDNASSRSGSTISKSSKASKSSKR